MSASLDSAFSYSKQVDYWVLSGGGFTISKCFVPLLWAGMGKELIHGEKLRIRIRVYDRVFDAQLINQPFDQDKYPGHPDVVQIRYRQNGELAKYLRTIFYRSYEYIALRKQQQTGKKQVKIPQELSEQFVFSTTSVDNEFIMDCMPLETKTSIIDSLKDSNELQFENLSETEKGRIVDASATIVEKPGIVRYRKIDKSICSMLKRLYDFRCQVTGERIGEKYDATVVEAHHIEYFTKSLNNDSSNIVIINPSFHRIIHQCNPVFNPKKLQFEFPNGVVEKLKLDKHLKG